MLMFFFNISKVAQEKEANNQNRTVELDETQKILIYATLHSLDSYETFF